MTNPDFLRQTLEHEGEAMSGYSMANSATPRRTDLSMDLLLPQSLGTELYPSGLEIGPSGLEIGPSGLEIGHRYLPEDNEELFGQPGAASMSIGYDMDFPIMGNMGILNEAPVTNIIQSYLDLLRVQADCNSKVSGYQHELMLEKEKQNTERERAKTLEKQLELERLSRT